MNVMLKTLSGIDDAIIALYQSKRSITPEKVNEISASVFLNTKTVGGAFLNCDNTILKEEFDNYIDKVLKYGKSHTTLLRFINISAVVFGLHRGAMDDFDSHAMRMQNRIVRSSTRLAAYGNEKSDYYKDKILTIDDLIDKGILTYPLTSNINIDGKEYMKVANGWVLKGMENDRDITRGLLPLSIPMSCIFSVNLADYAHIYKLRKIGSGANPELTEMIESLTDQLEEFTNGKINRDYLMSIEI